MSGCWRRWALSFGGLALLLLAVGIYGMLNAAMVRRTGEIGVRMALGATRRQIARMIAGEMVALLAAGLALGAAGYVTASRLIRTELFGVTAYDPTAVAAVLCTLVLIAGLAVWVPTLRATRIDPTDALRREHS